jgi:hypothetical protein
VYGRVVRVDTAAVVVEVTSAPDADRIRLGG